VNRKPIVTLGERGHPVTVYELQGECRDSHQDMDSGLNWLIESRTVTEEVQSRIFIGEDSEELWYFALSSNTSTV